MEHFWMVWVQKWWILPADTVISWGYDGGIMEDIQPYDMDVS
jgi:hypothetical protein